MILNLTQHPATPEQLAAGVSDLPDDGRAEISRLLTCEKLPTPAQVTTRALALALLASCHAHDADGIECPARVMIGGAPWMMAKLEAELQAVRLEPVYAFSVRESTEAIQPDGSVRKINTFRHAGFVSV